MSEDYFLLENQIRKSRENVIILSVLLFIDLLALFGVTFYSFDFISTMMWIFGGMYNQLLILFTRILLIFFPIFLTIIIKYYYNRYTSAKGKLKEFLEDIEIINR